MALVILFEKTVLAVLPKFMTPRKSLLLKVLTTAVAAFFVIVIFSYVAELDVSMIRMTFLAPDIAVTYQGLNLGS